MGTGGGEFLSKLPIPEYTCSTESYPPNIAISKNRLQPLGVNVLGINNDNKLPFGTDTFEVVINRQEYYSPSEVYRILKPDGFFVTQQVGAKDGLEINEILNAPMPEDHNPDWTLNFIIDELTEKKFKILYSFECRYTTRIYDIGALIYYLKAIPWQIPDFSVDLYYSELYSLHNRIEKTGYSDVTSERFLIVTKK
jgi:SAM-dependent methyltransferase